MASFLLSCTACGFGSDNEHLVVDDSVVVIEHTNSIEQQHQQKKEKQQEQHAKQATNKPPHHPNHHPHRRVNDDKEPNVMMRRASSSRRQEGFASPAVRSRSQERSSSKTAAGDLPGGDNPLETASSSSPFLDAPQEAASTDNDSAADDGNGNESGGDFDTMTPPRGRADSRETHKNQRGIHHRAMSDPFDTQEMKSALSDVLQQEGDAVQGVAVKAPPAAAAAASATPTPPPARKPRQHVPHKNAYPTMLRFPVSESRNKNCWSEPPVSIFSVRGPNYFADKKKQVSAPYLLTARGTDIFLFDKPVRLEERSHLILGGHLRALPTLLINFQFPWGVMVLYFEVPAKLAPYLQNPKTPLAADLNHAERTLAKWFVGDEDYKNDRLKLIPYVAEGPWVVRNMVTGRPAIIGRKLPVSYRVLPGWSASGHSGAPLCEVTLDIGSSSATAKRIVSVCRRYMSGLTSDIGFVIQAESPDELPEQMLGSIRVHGPDPLKAPKI